MNPMERSIMDEARDPGKEKTTPPLAAGPEMNHLPTLLPEKSQIADSESQLGPNPAIPEFENGTVWPLSGKPYFHLIITKSHLKPTFCLNISRKLNSLLPGRIVPAVVTYGNKSWDITFNGKGVQKKFEGNWKNFVIDNSLVVGDALVFELLEMTTKLLKFRVQILRGDFPYELLERVNGATSKAPLVLE